MRKRSLIYPTLTLALFFILSSDVLGQDSPPRVELGGVVSVLDLRSSIGEKAVGIGSRFTYNLADNFAIDSEVLRFPQSQGYYGYTQAMAGVKAGIRYRRLGAFAKIRPGLIHFNGGGFVSSNGGSKTNPAVDVGGVLELYSGSRRFAVRIDFGDTIIPFGNQIITRGGERLRPGTTHNRQMSFGITVRL
jgi:hypothetical protein